MKTKLLLFLFAFFIPKIIAQQIIYDFSPGAPQSFKKIDGKFYFEGYDINNGRALWQSDGTTGNTVLFKDTHNRTDNISTIKAGSAFLNGIFYFIAADENSAGEIWKTDGSDKGTEKVTDFLNGRVTNLTVVGNVIYFLIKKEDDKLEVWKTDGTNGGTLLVKEILSVWNEPSFEGQCNDVFVFAIQPAGTSNSRVWRSNGTPDGTFPLTEEMDGNGSGMVGGSGGSSFLTQFITHNNKLYFTSRYFLYETDGTAENTKNVATVRNPLFGGLIYHDDIIVVDNNLYLMFVTQKTFNNYSGSVSLLKFDTSNNTILSVYERKIDKYFLASNLTKIGNSLVFTSSNVNAGTELVSFNLTDNTSSNMGELAAASELIDTVVPLSIYLTSIMKFNENQYFIQAGRDKDSNRKGWVYDLNMNTLKNISNLDNVRLPFEFNNYLYYSKDGKLWKYSNNLNTEFITKDSKLAIYPNPSADFVKIITFNNEKVENIEVFDLNGRLVISTSNSSEINISNLIIGTYFAKIQIDGKLINKKIIKL